MAVPPRTRFTLLNAAERRSKIRQLSQAKGEIALWEKGSDEKLSFRVKRLNNESSAIILHSEGAPQQSGRHMLAKFEVHGVSFFFEGKTVTSESDDEWGIVPSEKFFKAERRKNFRLLAYPAHEMHASFVLPVSYEGGKIVDIKRRPGQTGLFKSFLKLVGQTSIVENREEPILRMRIRDLSITGFSIHIGQAELEWFETGVEWKDLEIDFSDEVIVVPLSKIVYVVDQIGSSSQAPRTYKVGFRFESPSTELQETISRKVGVLLGPEEIKQDFEEFLT